MSQPARAPHPDPAEPVTIALAGDVMLGRLVDRAIAAQGFAYPWGDVLPIPRQADLFLANLECTLTARTERWHDGQEKAFYFRADPAAVATLRLGRVDCVSLANNHSGDFGVEGLLETVATLDTAGIAHAGAGADLATARAPAILRAGAWRVGVVAFADYPAEWAATPTSPGMNYTPISLTADDFAPIRSALAEARRQADLVIFSIHWGPNMRLRPTAEFRAFARAVVQAGADVFWGHSAHVVQGIELFGGKPILYDTGDFVDDYAVDAGLRNDLSALFLLRGRPPVVEAIELVPVRIGRMQVNLARGAEREWLTRRLAGLCAELGTTLLPGDERLAVVVPAPGQPAGGAGEQADHAGR